MAETVTVSINYVRNLGNYETAKVGYSLSSDERRDGESLEEFRNRLKAKVQKWIVEDIEEIDAEAAEAKG